MAKTKKEKSLEQMLDEALVKENDWPYKVNKNWIFVKTKSVIENLFSGFACAKRFELDENNPQAYPHLRPNNIGFGGRINLNKIVHIPKSKVDEKKNFLEKGSVLFNNTNSKELVGRAILVKEDMSYAFSNHITKIELNTKVIDPKWFVYSINKHWIDGFFLDKSKKWVGQAGYNQEMLKNNTVISLPPIEEQKRIVKKLTSMLAKLKEARELIIEAKDSFENRRAAILNKAFTGELTKKWRYENPIIDCPSLKTSLETIPYKIPDQWKWVFLKDVSDKFQYGTSAKSEIQGEVPVIRMGNIQHGKIDWNDLKFTSDKTEIEKYNLNFNDVLFNRTNSPELVGKTAIYKGEMPAIFAGYLIKIKPQKHLNPDYLNYFLNSSYAKQKCLKVKTDGVNQSNINAKKLGNFEMPLPDIKEQQEIVNILDKIFIKEITTDELIDLEEHFDLLEKSILSKAFRGELDTNDQNDEPAIKLLEKALQSRKLTPIKPKTRKLKATIPAEIKTSDTSLSILKLSENAQRLLKQIKQYFGENRFNPDKLKDKSELSYEELKEALFELIKEPLEGKSKAKLKMNWDKGYLIQLS